MRKEVNYNFDTLENLTYYNLIHLRYNEAVFKALIKVFNCMPLMAIVGERILCMHGNLSPDMPVLALLNKLPHEIVISESKPVYRDILRSDSKLRLTVRLGPRDFRLMFFVGAAPTTSGRTVSSSAPGHGLDLIVREHEVADGYGFFGSGRWLVTIFRHSPTRRGCVSAEAGNVTVADTSYLTPVRKMKETKAEEGE